MRGAKAAMRSNRLKRGEMRLHEVSMSKEAFDQAPDEHKRLYLVLCQIVNKIMILQSLTKQAFNGMKGERAAQEVALGTGFLLLRILSGRLYESYLIISKESNRVIFDKLCDMVTDNTDRTIVTNGKNACENLRSYFEKPGSLLNRIRNKLAFHLDEKVLLEGANLLKDDQWPLVDFHAGTRGHTFFGGCDTVAAAAVSHLLGVENAADGTSAMMVDSMSIASAVGDFAEAFMLAFMVNYLANGYTSRKMVVLKDVPDFDRAQLHFFLTISAQTRARYQT